MATQILSSALRRASPMLNHTVVLVVAVAFLGLLFAVPSYASGTYYANSSDPAANDANSCRTAADPCLTLTGAVDKIFASANPANSTIKAAGTFAEQVVVGNAELEGLTLTWLNEGSRPVVDATGITYGVYVSGVNDVTIQHIDITGATSYGLFVVGGAGEHINGLTVKDTIIHDLAVSSSLYGMYIVYVDDALIKENTIENLDSTTTDTYDSVYAYGMYLSAVDGLKVMDNTIRNIVLSNTNSTATSSIYSQAYGMLITESDNTTVRSNTVDTVSMTMVGSAPASVFGYNYGIMLSGTANAVLRENTVEHIDTNLSTTAAGQYVYGIGAGITLATAIDSRLTRNTVKNSTQTYSATATEPAYGSFTGFSVGGLDNISLGRNTVQDVVSNTVSGTNTNTIIGISISDVQHATIFRSVLRDLASNHDSDGSASTTAIKLSDTPEADVFRNRIADFTANKGIGVSSIDTSIGIEIGYNSSADLLNNLIYFTAPMTQYQADGIQVLSSQATPVRIFHNTLHNVLTCLDVNYAGTIKFINNICSLVNGGAYGMEVSSEKYSMDQIMSNNNSFYNSTAPILFNDDDLGTLTYSDWKSGIYAQDTNSVRKNPKLNTDDPSSNKYLHLKKGSPLVNRANANVSFGDDEDMNIILERDWDSKARPHGKKPDIGADEL